MHQRIGERLELGYDEQTLAIAAELASHFERAGDQVRSVRYLGQAAQTALMRHAYVEANEHSNHALALLATLPATAERDRQELELQMTLGAALASKGYADPGMARAFDRAKELSQHLGDEGPLISAQIGLTSFYGMQANYQVAHELGERCVALARSTQDRNYLPLACGNFGELLLGVGEFTKAREYLEQGITLYDPQRHYRQAMEFGIDPGILCLTNGAIMLWFLGHPDQAVSRIKQAVTLARELAHAHSLAFAHFYATMIGLFRREPEVAQAEVETARAVALQYELQLFLADTQIQQGWILAQQGCGDEGIALMRKGFADREGLNVRGGRGLLLGWLVEACADVGRIEEALATLAEALAWAEETGERWYEAEYHRLRGELLLQQTEANAAQAEACFQQALTVARRQQAKSWELRAATSLARLWQEQGKSHAAYELLAPVYGWFSEGFAMPDLQQAQALLVELS
jgi:predicted ATPase